MRSIKYILILVFITVNLGLGGGPENPALNQFLIGFEKRIDPAARKALLDRYQGTIIKEINGYSFPVYLVEINRVSTDSMNPANVLDKLEHESGIMYVSLREKNDDEKEILDVYPTNPLRQGDFRITKPQTSKYASNYKPQTANSYEEIISLHIPELHKIAMKSNTNKKSARYNSVFEISIDKKGVVTYVRIVKSGIHDAGLRKKLRDFIYSWNDFPERTAPETLKVTFKFDM